MSVRLAAIVLLAITTGTLAAWPEDRPAIASIPNLRDVGGHATRDGRAVRTGLLYRSSQLVKISPTDQKTLAALGLKADFDLRNEKERKALPDELPNGVKVVWLDVMADADKTIPDQLRRYLQNPKLADATAVAKVEALFERAYRDFVSKPGARKAYGKLFTELADEQNLPAVIHCTQGKDRTGWAAAALLALLGVPEETIVADFLHSNDRLLPGSEKFFEGFAKAGGDPAVARAILAVKADYLKAAFDEVKKRHGTIEKYFSDGLGIEDAGQKALRERFVSGTGNE